MSSLKLNSSAGSQVTFDQECLKDGIKNFILDMNASVTIKVTPETQVVHMGATDYDCSYKNKVDYKAKLQQLEKTVVKVACATSNSLFVCEDESLYGIGQPNCHENYHNDCYSQPKTWETFSKPADCINYKKVVVSKSNRIILTKAGQLFC